MRSGYLYQRIYPNWDERRGGGSFSLGRQLGTSIYADMAVRAEEVDFFGYRSPAPANYLAASGFTSLFSIKPSLRWDNRNSPFMATKGQYVQLSAEQGLGSFTWTKFDAEGRMYIPTFSRPDGTGKQFFTLRGHFGIATDIDAGLRAILRGQLRQPARVSVSNGQSARLQRPHGRHHDGRGVGRVPVSLERARHLPSDHFHRLRHGHRQLRAQST